MEKKRRSAERMVLTGEPVSGGIAVAKAYLYKAWESEVTRGCFEPGREEEKLEAFHCGIEQAREELSRLGGQSEAACGEQAEIFRAQRVLLEDRELLAETELAIRKERLEPDAAVEKVFTKYAGMIGCVEDPLIAARAADLHDVRKRLLRILQGREERTLSRLKEDVILVADELLPSDTASMDRVHVKGILTKAGGTNSHSAILARSFRIPAVAGVGEAAGQIPDGALLALDAMRGQVILWPTKEEIRDCGERQEKLLRRQAQEEPYLDRPGATRDGAAIKIGINIGSCGYEVPEKHYDFVGLFRTEFLYMEKSALPTEEEQFETYRSVLVKAGGKTVTLRTLDIGGDKKLSCLPLPGEENPFLGSRGLRLCFACPEIFRTQLRAALRASVYGSLRIMFPMVCCMEDIRRGKECVKRVMEELDREHIAYDRQVKLGIMIEVPSIAVIADMAAEEVDFAGVGTNDLTQYVCAADRSNPVASAYYQSESPAMLRLLKGIFSAFEKAGKEVCVCGEMAGDPETAVLLVGLGARKLSMSDSALGGVKAALAMVTLEEARELAEECMTLRTREEIRQRLNQNRRS